MARFPSIDETGAFEAPEVRNHIKQLVTGEDVGITVDTSVGTRVFVGDTMIYGDTGWRDIRGFLEPDVLDVSGVADIFTVRRVGDNVMMSIRALVGPNLVGQDRSQIVSLINNNFPDGFYQTPASYGTLGVFLTSTGEVAQISNRSGARFLRLNGVSGQWQQGERLAVTAFWGTTLDWPTALPGVPA